MTYKFIELDIKDYIATVTMARVKWFSTARSRADR